jgi:hypothetical protein
MSQTIFVNGKSISYPETGDPNWGDEATDFAVQTSAAFGKLGLASGTSVDVAQTLDVTGNTTLDANLSVGGDASVTGNTTLTGNITVNGNSTLGNGTSDTTAISGILNVDSGVLYVDPTNNRVGINDATPSQALDVTGNALVSGTLGVTGNSTFTGDVITSTVKASGSGGLTIDSNGGTDVALFGAGGGTGTTLYGGLNGTTGNFADTTDATSSTDGALKTAGGVGIAKKLFVGTSILTGDGSVSSPSISLISDPNSGIYSIGADKIGFSANGARVGEFGDGYGGFVGNVIQVAYAEITTSGASSAVNIPVDNTIPQQTEGAEILTCSITPKYANSILYVESNSFIGENVNSSNSMTVALFRDSTSNAISASFNNGFPGASSPYGASLSFNPTYLLAKVTSGSTASTTFKLRAGGDSSAVIRWNGTGGAQFFNGTLITYIRITEVQV